MELYRGEEGYLKLLLDILNNGEKKLTRNGTVISQFGTSIVFNNINELFPLLTTKKLFFRGVVEELLWFLRGSTYAKELQDKNIHIWDGNSSRDYLDSIGLVNYKEGELGPVYGHQWRNFNGTYKNIEKNGIDQLVYIIDELRKNNNSRRAVLSAWNPSQLNEMALPPCHLMYNFYKNSKGLSCMMTMRSSDLFLGLPFNIASTALLTHIIAKILHIEPINILISSNDAHIYEEHIQHVLTQTERDVYKLPKLQINIDAPPVDSDIKIIINWIENLKYENFELYDYKCHDTIKTIMK
jgi:dihydrofolate reductase/thymidylate synthase